MFKVSRWSSKAVQDRKFGRLAIGLLFLALTGFLLASQDSKPADQKPADQKAAAEQAAASSPSAAKPAPAEYVGSETCAGCHEEVSTSFERNRHHAVEAGKSKWSGKACEACHGPGSKHAESADPADILNPGKLAPIPSERICLSCHKNSFTHSGRVEGGHGRNQVSCVACHSVHKRDAINVTTGRARAINAQCAGCHQQTWAEFQKPHRHALPEGAMSCVDCHNPHSNFRPRMVNTVNANDPSCIRCHTDKRGPFTFEHPPVKMEGCRSCHEPHGSANPRMLTRAQQMFTCLECHSNVGLATAQTGNIGGVPPAFHDLRNPRYRECSVCHIKVHGSHVNRSFLR